jgi:hypothetical protein
MIVCADDYGLRDDIDLAILNLCDSGRLSAVSCMVALERCTPSAMSAIQGYRDSVDIGLHFCLTNEAQPLSPSSAWRGQPEPFPEYGPLLRRALRGKARREEIAAQVAAQYELFLEKAGRRPDHIDGHLHIHQLPGIRDGLMDFVRTLPANRWPYIRNTALSVRELWQRRLPWTKSALIGNFGARMRRILEAEHVPTNLGFSGIYDFRRWRQYPVYLPKFIACLEQPNGILVVHPGEDEDWRRQEFKMLGEFPFTVGMPNRFRLNTKHQTPNTKNNG